MKSILYRKHDNLVHLSKMAWGEAGQWAFFETLCGSSFHEILDVLGYAYCRADVVDQHPTCLHCIVRSP